MDALIPSSRDIYPEVEVLAEKSLIEWIRGNLVFSDRVLVHSGDDLAVVLLPGGDRAAFGIDTVAEGVDFFGPSSETPTPPEKVGRKALAVNLSDIAAMGAVPVACTVSVSIPPGTAEDFLRALYSGMKRLAEKFGVPVVGGDITAAEGPLSITISVMGTFTPEDTPLLRSSARPGDALFVTGPLGGSILGKHLDFMPRIPEGRLLAASGLRCACIDISDGLSSDALHLAQESEVRIILEEMLVPISKDAERLSEADGRPPLEHALHDGEDFELLFTLPAGKTERLFREWPQDLAFPIRVGRVEKGPPGVFMEKAAGGLTPLEPEGYEHRF